MSGEAGRFRPAPICQAVLIGSCNTSSSVGAAAAARVDAAALAETDAVDDDDAALTVATPRPVANCRNTLRSYCTIPLTEAGNPWNSEVPAVLRVFITVAGMSWMCP